MGFWTEERVELLKKLWAQGMSAGKIERRMGATSRSAVIGKIHRLDLPGRATTKSDKSTMRSFQTKQAHAKKKAEARKDAGSKFGRPSEPSIPDGAVASQAVPLPGEPDSKRKSIIELESRECRWPHGDGPFHFCGHETVAGLPYCAAHSARAFRPPDVKPRSTFRTNRPPIGFGGGASRRNEFGSGKATPANENHATARANEFDEVE